MKIIIHILLTIILSSMTTTILAEDKQILKYSYKPVFVVPPFVRDGSDTLKPNKGAQKIVEKKHVEHVRRLRNLPEVKSISSANINKEILNLKKGEHVSLNVTSKGIAAKIDKIRKKQSGWSHVVATNKAEKVYIEFVAKEDIYSGSIRIDKKLYKIKPVPGIKEHTLVLIDENKLQDHDANYFDNYSDHVPNTGENGNSGAYSGYTESGSEFTVIVAYTSLFNEHAGGAEAYLQLAESETNTSYDNSFVDTKVRIIQSYQTNYTESGNFQTDLANLLDIENNNDAQELASLRNKYHADLMILMVGNDSAYGGGCGRAQGIGVSEDLALAVVRESCGTGYYSFGHEIGHLFGARHIITQDSSGTPFAYGHGYCSLTENTFRTVMAYGCPSRTGGPRVQNWSNPDVSIGDDVTGTFDLEDNARVLDERSEEIANFRVNDISYLIPIVTLILL